MQLKNKLIITIIVVISVIAVSLYLVLSNEKKGSSLNKTSDLVVCDGNKEKEVSRLRQDGGIVKDMEEDRTVLVGFYTNRNSYHLQVQGAAKNIAERLGWNDFIEGFAPPTPLLFDNPQTFQDGDLIEIEVRGYETIETGGPGLWSSMDVIRASKATKLSLPTRQDFIKQAEATFAANAKDIFQCVDSKPTDFPSFESGIERTVVWDRSYNQALVTYQGTKEYRGNVKVIAISILLDQSGTPTSILVGSKVVPLTL